ncbi:MAG: PAS domain-containing protein [Pseudolabrys sp.]
MKHASTRRVYEYWNEKRGDRMAPERADIDPVQIRHALGDTFMLAADFVDLLRFRLAGTRVCALFGREIKGEAFDALWDAGSRKAIDELMAVVVHEGGGAVAGVTAHADGMALELELLLLPLAHIGHARIRAIGVLAPLSQPYWLGAKPVGELALGTLRHLGPRAEAGLAPFDPLDVRVRHGFVVYSGGRGEPGERAG